MRVDVDDAARSINGGQRPQRAERDRVVAAQHEREGALLERLAHEPATSSQIAFTSGRKRACTSLKLVASTTGVWMLPQSSTSSPIAASLLSSPA